MTIDDYLAVSRRLGKPHDALVRFYSDLYDHLAGQVKRGRPVPALVVTFSPDRRCERVCIESQEYIVYDQYLGQSFNHLNRIFYARHSWKQLVTGYALKYLAERCAIQGSFVRGLSYATRCQIITKMARFQRHNPFDMEGDSLIRRSQLTGVCEAFVLSHELGHSAYAEDTEARTSGMEAIRNSLIDEVMHKLTSDEFVNLENRYGKRFANTVRVKEENVRESRLEAFLNLEHWLLPEMLMDNFASAMVLQVLHGIMGIPVEIVAEGVLLSFKYSRLFRHLDILAEELTRLDREAPYLSADERLVLAKEMPRRVWGSDRHNMVIYMQFREGWHRMQLLEHAKRLFGVDIATIAEHLANVSDEYDERIERFITVDLSHWVAREEKKMVRLQRAAEGEPSALLRLIDEKTGWKSLWPNDDRETVMCG